MSDRDPSLDALWERGPQAAAAQLIMPALDVREGESEALGEAMALMAEDPFVGFVIFGGEREQVARMTRSLRRIAQDKGFLRPWFSADVERGLGQIVAGGSVGPALEALGACGEQGAALARELGAAIAAEALAVGIDWPFVPVLDLADTAGNPIIGSRAFHAEPERVAELGAAFIQGVMSTGALACGKHYPGHGGSLGDSHDSLPTVPHSGERLRTRDLVPFRAAIAVGVDALMTAHVCYPKLGHPRLPATLDPVLLKTLLREELGYQGLAVTDAFIMDGLLEACGGDESAAAVAAIDAGCDIILMPKDPRAVRDVLAMTIEARGRAWAEPALGRILRRKARPVPINGDPEALAGAARAVMEQIILTASDADLTTATESAVSALIIDDDDGGEGQVPAVFFLAELRARFPELRLRSASPSSDDASLARLTEEARGGEGPLILCIRCSVRAWKGRSELHPRLVGFLRELLSDPGGRPISVVGLCGPSALPEDLRGGALFVYGEGPVCEEAAVRLLLTDLR